VVYSDPTGKYFEDGGGERCTPPARWSQYEQRCVVLGYEGEPLTVPPQAPGIPWYATDWWNRDRPCLDGLEVTMVDPDGHTHCHPVVSPILQLEPLQPQTRMTVQICLTPLGGIVYATNGKEEDDTDNPRSGGPGSPGGSSGGAPKGNRNIYYVEDGPYYFKAEIVNGRVDLNVKTNINGVYGSIRAEEEFNKMLDYFGRSRVRTVRGVWDTQAPGLTANIERFNRLTAGGMRLEDAAFEVSTGQWAKKAGYDKIISLHTEPQGAKPGEYDLVLIEFGQ
jgi:hypothetical protein